MVFQKENFPRKGNESLFTVTSLSILSESRKQNGKTVIRHFVNPVVDDDEGKTTNKLSQPDS